MIKKNSKIKSDAELCLLIRKNDKVALECLYLDYCCILYGLALRSVKSQVDAQEIVQLTFLKIWKNIDLFEGQKLPLKIWVIQNLMTVIREFLTSKNIKFNFTIADFPNFSFELIQDNTEDYRKLDIDNLKSISI